MKKDTIKLEEVDFLGEGFFHWFHNNKTQELEKVECTEEEYTSLTQTPVKKGSTYLYSCGGVIKANTTSGFLEEGQFIRKGEHTFVHLNAKEMGIVPNEAIDESGDFDKNIWKHS